ncbi:hypothetical protein ACEUCV_15695 [Aeromonas veronii]
MDVMSKVASLCEEHQIRFANVIYIAAQPLEQPCESFLDLISNALRNESMLRELFPLLPLSEVKEEMWSESELIDWIKEHPVYARSVIVISESPVMRPEANAGWHQSWSCYSVHAICAPTFDECAIACIEYHVNQKKALTEKHDLIQEGA